MLQVAAFQKNVKETQVGEAVAMSFLRMKPAADCCYNNAYELTKDACFVIHMSLLVPTRRAPS
jgi:hypothetical protein